MTCTLVIPEERFENKFKYFMVPEITYSKICMCLKMCRSKRHQSTSRRRARTICTYITQKNCSHGNDFFCCPQYLRLTNQYTDTKTYTQRLSSCAERRAPNERSGLFTIIIRSVKENASKKNAHDIALFDSVVH